MGDYVTEFVSGRSASQGSSGGRSLRAIITLTKNGSNYKGGKEVKYRSETLEGEVARKSGGVRPFVRENLL